MPPSVDIEANARQALSHYPALGDASDASITPLGGGLINSSLLVRWPAGTHVLQKLSRIFDPAIHHNIDAFTCRLAERGLRTPRLQRTASGGLWAQLEDGSVWRLLNHIEGCSFERVGSAAQAGAAGALVGRVHAALDGLEHAFCARRLGVHDTAAHLEALRQAVARHSAHRLASKVAPIAAQIELAARGMPPLELDAERICHGDLKLSNLLFEGPEPPASERAICLIDLDTVGPLALAYELGDAWRSWCNPAREDAAEPHFDLDVFAAAWSGYSQSYGRPVSMRQRRALLDAPSWVALELSARFAADALCESYFGWDRTRYRSRGAHNLARAHSQLTLHRAVQKNRSERARLLGVG